MSKKNDLRNRVAQVLVGILLATPVTSPVGSATREQTQLAPAYTPSSSFDPFVGAGVPLPILQGVTWAYFKGTVEPSAAWNTISFNDGPWLVGVSGIGYGDGDDATVLSDMQNSYTTVYMRRQFDVPSPAAVHGLDLRVDYDDGFVAYLNGVEVARRNAPAGTPAFNAVAPASHEASAGSSGNPAETISLNAFLNVLVPGTNVLAVQGLNRALSSTDLTMIVELREVNAPPAAPSSPSPANGASNVPLSQDLCVGVSDPDGGSLTATFYGREVTGTAGQDFTIIAVPDTQYASASFPSNYTTQTQWIVDNRVARNIVFVTQLGDCVDNATVNQQFVNADAAWDIIEANPFTGQPWGMPYGIAVGNHDQSPSGDPGTLADEGATTGSFNTWFGVSRYTGRSYYAGHYGSNNDNHYELFSASGMDFIAIHLEYMPTDTPLRQAVLAWANGVLQANPNRRAIVTSHYLMETGTSTAFGNQGQATYDALRGNANLFLMLAGHLDQASRRTDTFNGRTVHTLKSDFQTRPNGGNGWLRIMTFSPQNNEIRVQTYSPTLGQFINNHADNIAGTAQNDFVVSYAMTGGTPFTTIGSAVQSSGGTACVSWPGRQAGKQYEWYVTVGDGTDTTTGSTNTFTTAATCTNNSQCSDGNVCNGTETCGAGSVCQAGTALNCADSNACTADSCAPATGCQHTAVSCDDTNPCTTDACVPATGCQHQAVSCPAGEVCNAQNGQCQAPATICSGPADCNDGNVCTTDTCNSGNAASIDFDGTNDYVTMGAAPGLNASPAFTVEAWINGTTGQALDTTGTSGISDSIPLVTKGGPQDEVAGNNMNYYLGLKSSILVADFEDNVNGTNHPICGSTTIGAGWHHVAATYTGTTWALYVDGATETLSAACSTCAACTATPGVAPESASQQHFALGTSLETDGSFAGSTAGFYGGRLDEVRVWNVARSQAQIQASRFLELTSGTGLIGRWGLNEGSGLTTADSTSPIETGTLTSGPAWDTASVAPLLSGTCGYSAIPGCELCNGNEECLDANVCNGVETCSGGVCQSGTLLNCDDGNPCTSDSCDAEDGCQHGIESCSDANACTADSCGSSNSSYATFDGNGDYIAFGPSSSHTELGAARFTLEAWIKWDGTEVNTTGTGTGGITALPIVAKGRAEQDATNQDMNYFMGLVGGKLAADFEEGLGACIGGTNPGASCYLSCSTTTATRCSLASQCPASEACTTVNGCTGGGTCSGAPGLNHPVTGAATVAVNVWTHVAATYDGDCFRLYVNGAADGLPVCTGNRLPRADSIQPFAIGTAMTSTNAAAGFFPGAIDEVRVWNYARTAAQILGGMSDSIRSDSANPAARLIGRWGLDEGSGTSAGDSAGLGNGGTLTGNAAFAATAPTTLTGCLSAYSPSAGCCTTGADCNDGNTATTDTCSGGTCSNTLPAICTTAADCNDNSVCTTDTCVSGNVSALKFDGSNDYVTMGAAAGETALGARAFTLESWVRRDGASWGATTSTGTGGVTAVPLVTKGRGEAEGSNVDSNYFLGITAAGQPVADFEQNAAGSGWAAGQNHPACSSATIADQNWHHVAVTYSTATGWHFYVDGVEGTTADGTSCTTCSPAGSCPQNPAVEPRYDSIQHFALGTAMTSTGTAAGFFGGLMDEPRVWSRALSLAEIQAGLHQELASGTGLIGRWGLNENGGTTAVDSTVPAQNGTLTNGPVYSPADRAALGTCQRASIAGCCTSASQCDDLNPCTNDACSANACAYVNNTASCSDGNNCTVNDACSGGACGGTTITVPAEVTNFRFGTNKTTMTWNSAAGAGPGTVHDMVRGFESSLPVGSGVETCLQSGLAAATTSDANSPPVGQAFWYLVRGQNACGKGTYGSQATHGVPTVPRITSACP